MAGLDVLEIVIRSECGWVAKDFALMADLTIGEVAMTGPNDERRRTIAPPRVAEGLAVGVGLWGRAPDHRLGVLYLRLNAWAYTVVLAGHLLHNTGESRGRVGLGLDALERRRR